MMWVEVFGGVLLVVAGLACLRARQHIDEWSFTIWTVPSDYDPPSWFRSVSSYVVVAIFLGLGAGLIVTAVA